MLSFRNRNIGGSDVFCSQHDRESSQQIYSHRKGLLLRRRVRAADFEPLARLQIFHQKLSVRGSHRKHSESLQLPAELSWNLLQWFDPLLPGFEFELRACLVERDGWGWLDIFQKLKTSKAEMSSTLFASIRNYAHHNEHLSEPTNISFSSRFLLFVAKTRLHLRR